MDRDMNPAMLCPDRDGAKEAMEFFRALYQNCEGNFLELRYLPSREQDFVPLEALENLPEYPDGENVYFGVGSRDGRGGGAENVVQIPSVWVDLDVKDTSTTAALKDAVVKIPAKPSIVVHSGGGYHCYWILKEPAGRHELSRVVDVNRRLAHYLVLGDPASTDAARILRVPGTWNMKHVPPLMLRYRQRRRHRPRRRQQQTRRSP